MFIGTYEKQKSNALGVVAELCPICRAVRPMLLVVHQQGSNLFPGVRVGNLTTLGHTVTCTACGSTHATDATIYGQPVQNADAIKDIDSLTRDTHPGLSKETLAHAEASEVPENPMQMTRDQRLTLMMQTVDLVEPQVVSGLGGSLNGVAGCGITILLLGTFLVATGAFIVAALTIGEDSAGPAVGYSAGITAIIGLLLTIIGIVIDKPLRYKRHVIPMLAAGHAPLHPTPQDIEQVLIAMRSFGPPYIRNVRAKDLIVAIDRAAQQNAMENASSIDHGT